MIIYLIHKNNISFKVSLASLSSAIALDPIPWYLSISSSVMSKSRFTSTVNSFAPCDFIMPTRDRRLNMRLGKCFMASILFHRPYGDGVRLPINQRLVVPDVLRHTATLDVSDQRTGGMALRRSFEGENPRTSRADVQYVFHRNFHFLLSFFAIIKPVARYFSLYLWCQSTK